ncbi:UbiA prenyltransferase family-domain-containing protein [Mycena pura]|uniref:UbiA prenyltransferase family-domain-containing protein n=1 Tax=Mycena pura TaxID=153505 RepID=A0AAD6VVU3_9AGAR|nr:UbiA prenyltransferase family-domain-containing protein [Mycena pura]
MPLHFFKTILLFSKSDLVPILGPSLAVAMVLAGPTDIISFITGFFWLELHLLTFEIKNQIVGVEEDRLSKPYRPVAAGRLCVSAAQRLYVVVGVCAFAWSVYLGLALCSAVYMVAIYCYNEGGMSRHWFLKSFLGSIGYVCYCWGTTTIFDHGNPLSTVSVTAIAMSGLLHVTTGHAQDFRDLEGDAAIGRKTLPMLLPSSLARWSLALLLATWTSALVRLWAPPAPAALALALFALAAVTALVRANSVAADRAAYWWYNMWLITAHFLPLFTPARIAAWRAVDPTLFCHEAEALLRPVQRATAAILALTSL